LIQFRGSGSLIGKRAKRAIIASRKERRFARLAQIPFDCAQGKISLRKETLLRMTIRLSHCPLPGSVLL
jgi:hypothetical protein